MKTKTIIFCLHLYPLKLLKMQKALVVKFIDFSFDLCLIFVYRYDFIMNLLPFLLHC